MTALNPAKNSCPPEGHRLIATTDALRTGLFQSIEGLDPDIVRQPRISTGSASLWNRLFGQHSDR
ncbi:MULTISPECIES: hypothetical protein [Glutamicibacter]|uniref:Uncharacterized protein n=2 Tax=Glutamicibacter arilaitensis TaxID=256701 RepID=A0A4Y8TVX6_9MICC|nr:MULTISPECIES: hypothetical protein [Glutamicibacter]TFH55714.1 hypothetical protein EXY26_01085 [Glutamicibacter arilaitensis]CBT77563.1 hypothetical protein AARI_33740 [Glutamicibacter arilaitensis Re117]HCH46781.1 hypothetical protein [Glutamicibacter sp.]